MSEVEYVPELGGLPAYAFPSQGEEAGELPAADAVAWRLSAPSGVRAFARLWRRFARTVDLRGVRALIIGSWGRAWMNDSSTVVRRIVADKSRLTSLRSVFLGDRMSELAGITWTEQSDVTPLLHAFPGLEELGIRGGNGLRFPAVRHTALRTLRIEAGGLPREVVRGVAASDLPSLEHLELWLGDPDYGGDARVSDLAPVLAGGRLPALRHLGLQNSVIQDEIAAAVAGAPVVAGLTSLSLSMGTLTDAGAEALLGGRSLTHLKRLDLHYNFLTEPMGRRVVASLPGVEVDVSEEGDADYESDDGQWFRYIAVGE